ncbi:RICIN domain-containing protein [Streptomyces sp. NBC_00354]|nr:RICIN domain-containing protein [Streptomyces sp. NBC_01001]
MHTASGRVLDVTGGATANGTPVQLYTANTNKRQVWVTPK